MICCPDCHTEHLLSRAGAVRPLRMDRAGVFHRLPHLDDARQAEIFAREVLELLVNKRSIPTPRRAISSQTQKGISYKSRIYGRNEMLSESRRIVMAVGGVILGVLSMFASIQSPADLPLLAQSDFENGRADGWLPKDFGHWRIIKKGESMVYELTAAGEQGKIRAPTSWSLVAGHDVTSFVLTGRLQCYADTANLHRDMCVVFHYQDPAHFYYVHFSATSDGAHNVISLVNGADRVKINTEPEGKSVFRLTDKNWHAFKMTYDDSTGDIKAYLDDMNTPILTARDRTLGRGMVGIGSFDDTGCFDDVKLWGKK